VKNNNSTSQIEKISYFDVDGDAGKSLWREAQEIVFCDAVTGEPIEKNQAKAKMLRSDEGLFILWQVEDEHIWGTYKKDDDPIYNEEVVEIFIAEGEDDPKKYFEFQFSPLGVKFDAKIKNPTGSRHDKRFNVDTSWDCKGLKFVQKIYLREGSTLAKEVTRVEPLHKKERPRGGIWTVEAFIPWKSISVKNAKSGDIFRANLFRIDGYPKQNSFQAWQPTMQDPPNFHVPAKFGFLELE